MTADKYLMPPMSPGGLFMIEKMIEITAVTYHQRIRPALFNKQFANRVLFEDCLTFFVFCQSDFILELREGKG